MKHEYIVTNEYLAQKGLDLNEYALEGTLVEVIIELGLDIAISRICYLNDNMSEEDLELYLDANPKLVRAFYKLQYRIIYNLIFQNETSPTDLFVDTIIVHELKLGKINGFQKGLYYRQGR